MRNKRPTQLKSLKSVLGLLIIAGVSIYSYFSPKQISQEQSKTELSELVQEASEPYVRPSALNDSDKIPAPVVDIDLDKAVERGYPSNSFCSLNLSSDRPVFDKDILSNDTYMLCYEGFATVYKGDFKTSLMSAERLTPQRIRQSGKFERAKEFIPDPVFDELYKNQSDMAYITSRDYIPHKKNRKVEGTCTLNHTCDRGHLSPSFDMDSLLSRTQSNYLSNIVPQSGESNKGVWGQMEHIARCAAFKEGEVYVINLPIYQRNSQGEVSERMFIGNHRVGPAVPAFMAKIIYSPRRQLASVYITENSPNPAYELISLRQLNTGRFLGKDIGPLYIEPFPGAMKSDLSIDRSLPNPRSSASVSKYCSARVQR